MQGGLASDLLLVLSDEHKRSPKRAFQRICTAEETFRRIKPLFARAGITRIADVTGLDRLRIPVAMVTRPNSRALSVSQGKGLDFTAAKVSGAMESLESFHAERVDGPVHLLRWAELAGTDRAVDPFRLPRLRNSLFHSERRIPWMAAVDVLSSRERLVPLELVHTDFTLPVLPGTGCFPRSSNGLASGNSYGEAIVHGLCELIERDAHAIFLRRPDQGPRVDLATIGDAVLLSLIERIEGAGCRLTLRDITSDTGVPVFFATITGGGESGVTAAPAGGVGCHPDRVWACVRAITEAAQSRLTRLSGSRDDLTRHWFRPTSPSPGSDRADTETTESPFDSGHGYCGETVEDDLLWITERLVGSGFDSILAVDLSRPEFGLPVMRVVVPGLEQPGSEVAPGPRASAR